MDKNYTKQQQKLNIDYLLSTKHEWVHNLLPISKSFWNGFEDMVDTYHAVPKELWDCVISLLKGEIPVPLGKKHHKLYGSMEGKMDLHIPNSTTNKRDDWLLIYEYIPTKTEKDRASTIKIKSLELVSTGTHKSTLKIKTNINIERGNEKMTESRKKQIIKQAQLKREQRVRANADPSNVAEKGIIVNFINSTWEAIGNYESIPTFGNYTEEQQGIFTDIITDLKVHVGLLQSLLDSFGGDTDTSGLIQDGLEAGRDAIDGIAPEVEEEYPIEARRKLANKQFINRARRKAKKVKCSIGDAIADELLTEEEAREAYALGYSDALARADAYANVAPFDTEREIEFDEDEEVPQAIYDSGFEDGDEDFKEFEKLEDIDWDDDMWTEEDEEKEEDQEEENDK